MIQMKKSVAELLFRYEDQVDIGRNGDQNDGNYQNNSVKFHSLVIAFFYIFFAGKPR